MDYFTSKRLQRRLYQFLIYFIFLLTTITVLSFVIYETNKTPKKLSNMTNVRKDSLFQSTNITVDQNLKSGLNIHFWDDLCGYTVSNLREHPLFPHYPFRRDFINEMIIRRNIREFGARIFGYLNPVNEGIYQFAISSDDGSELWLSVDHDSMNSRLIASVSGQTGKEWSYENQFNKYPTQISGEIHLLSGRRYYIEALWKQERVRGHIQVVWKTPIKSQFQAIPSHFLSRFIDDADIENGLVYSSIKQNKNFPSHLKSSKKHDFKNRGKYTRQSPEFLSLSHVDFEDIKDVIQKCDYKPSWIIERNSLEASKLPEYGGVHLPHYFNISTTVFPIDETWELTKECVGSGSLTRSHCNGNNVGDEITAKWVTNKFMTALQNVFPNQYTLDTMVNVEQSRDEQHGDRFLLELVLKDNFLKEMRRLSVYLFRPKKSLRLCFPKDFQWKKDAMVNLVLTVKNQGAWVQQYINSLSNIYQKTNDSNFKLILIDFESFDANLEDMLKMSKLPHWQLIKKTGKFHKTSAIQEAIDGIKDVNSIALQTDLHLEFPINFIDDTRKHCVQGRMGYTPLLMRLACGRYGNKPAGYWEAFGYGIFGIYKSDWDVIGGMDVEKFRNTWGGEDWDFGDRVIKNGLEIERLRVPYFFHYFHTKKGMWDNKV